jgi:RNA polymerase sigma-70 factor (ECF subfamily)
MDDEKTLVARARGGDYAAFEALVDRHDRRLYGIAFNIVRRREDAEDAVQTAFLNALEHLGGFREEASFSTWITHIAANEALKVLRKRRGLPVASPPSGSDEDEGGDIPHPEFIADWRDEPSRLVEGRELQKILDEAIEGLTEKHRLVFVLRDVVGKSVEETAEALGISRANVKVRLLRARLALREKLTRVFGDEERRLVRTHGHEGDDRLATPAADLLRSYREDEGEARDEM